MQGFTTTKIIRGVVNWLLVASFTLLGVNAQAASVIFWNKLGNDQEVLNSEIGPNLEFYSYAIHGGSGPLGEAQHEYVTGVFRNAVTIGLDNYNCCQRIHNLVLNNLSNFISAEKGTIATWYKQTTSPVPYQNNPYRIFDGSFGLDSPLFVQVNIDNQWNQARLFFWIKGNSQSVEVVSLTDGRVGYDMSGRNNEWIHIGAVWDRSGIAGTDDTMRLYVNGLIIASSQQNGWVSSLDGKADIAGGNDASIAEKFFVDNMVIYDYAKTDFSDRFLENPIQSAPTVITNAPSVVTATSARLSGTVNPNGGITNANFDWGKTTNYGANIVAIPATIAANAGPTNVYADLTGLTCNTTYHYRAKVDNSAGTAVGTNQTLQ